MRLREKSGDVSGFRCDIIRLAEFELHLVGPVLEPAVTAIGLLRGMRMCEIPGDEPERTGGRSKLSIPYNGSCILLMIVRLSLLRVFGSCVQKSSDGH